MNGEFREPPDLDRMRIDFSEFHDLMHTVWSCRGYPGGRRQHLALRWDFQWRPRLRAATLCKAGRHDPVQWCRPKERVTWQGCADCGKRLSNEQPY